MGISSLLSVVGGIMDSFCGGGAELKTKKLRPCKNAKTKLKNHFAVPLCLPARSRPLLRVTCASRRKTGLTPGRAAVCVLSALPPNARLSVQGIGQRSRSSCSAITRMKRALATRGQCEHCLPLVGHRPTSNGCIIARLGGVVKREIWPSALQTCPHGIK